MAPIKKRSSVPLSKGGDCNPTEAILRKVGSPKRTIRKRIATPKKSSLVVKVRIGNPLEYIQDVLDFCKNPPEAVIDEDEDEVSFNIKEGTPVLIRKRKRFDVSNEEPNKKKRKTQFPKVIVKFVSDAINAIEDISGTFIPIENEILEEIKTLGHGPLSVKDEIETHESRVDSSFHLVLSDEETTCDKTEEFIKNEVIGSLLNFIVVNNQ